MEAFALYLIKSVIWLTGFTTVYYFFLRNERFFLLNRIYLIAGMLTSFIFPLISIHYTVTLPAVNIQTTSSVSILTQGSAGIMQYLRTPLFTLYLSGVIIVIALVLKQGKSVLKTIEKSEIITTQPVKLVKTHDYASAFSFFSYVFVNPSATEIETKEIMIHELAHIRQKHWFDLLLAELLCTMQWFNPLVWIYIRFIRQNHEYLADKVALQQTTDPAIYKAVLLNQIVGSQVVSLTNSFNYSPNKKRFNMMKNIRTSPYRKMKVLLILPVFALVLYSFARPDYKYKVSQVNVSVSTDTTKNANKKSITPPPPPPPAPDKVQQTPAAIEGQPAPPPPPVMETGKEESQPLVSPQLKVDVALEVPVILDEPVKVEVKPLIVIDGVVDEKAVVTDIKPEIISSVDVLKDETGTAKYGEKGKNGVVEITTINGSISTVPKSADNLLVIIDGKISKVDLNTIDPNTIESISVFKDEDAVKKYGEKGKDGVIEVVTKK